MQYNQVVSLAAWEIREKQFFLKAFACQLLPLSFQVYALASYVTHSGMLIIHKENDHLANVLEGWLVLTKSEEYLSTWLISQVLGKKS